RPTQDNGTLALTGIGVTGAPARINFKVAQPIAAYIFVPSPNQEFALAINDATQRTPLGVPPTQSGIAAIPIGGAVSVAQLPIGHKGIQVDNVIDVPPGETVAIPFGGSFGNVNTFLTPKYFNIDPDAEPGTGFRTYILFPGGPRLAEPPTAGAAPPTPGTSGVGNDMDAPPLPR